MTRPDDGVGTGIVTSGGATVTGVGVAPAEAVTAGTVTSGGATVAGVASAPALNRER